MEGDLYQQQDPRNAILDYWQKRLGARPDMDAPTSVTGLDETPQYQSWQPERGGEAPPLVTAPPSSTAIGGGDEYSNALLKALSTPRKDSLSAYWGQPAVGKIPLDMFTTLAGSTAHALAPLNASGRMGASLAELGGAAYGERMRREYEGGPNALIKNLMDVARFRKEMQPPQDATSVFLRNYMQTHPGSTLEDATRAHTDLTTRPSTRLFPTIMWRNIQTGKEVPVDPTDREAQEDLIGKGFTPVKEIEKESKSVGTEITRHEGDKEVKYRITGYDENRLPIYEHVPEAVAPRWAPKAPPKATQEVQNYKAYQQDYIKTHGSTQGMLNPDQYTDKRKKEQSQAAAEGRAAGKGGAGPRDLRAVAKGGGQQLKPITKAVEAEIRKTARTRDEAEKMARDQGYDPSTRAKE
jgi:hypothetical protein